MKKYVAEFCKRGMMACWGGPVVLAVIYGVLGYSGAVETLTPMEVTKGILTLTLMAFTAGGITMVYQIEKLPLFPAVLLHGIVLYLDYLMMYLVNDWIADGLKPLLIFTAVFAAGYAVIWVIIYGITRSNARKLNRYLKET